MAVAEVLFWVAAGLLVYTHVGYPLVLALAARRRRARPPAAPAELPRVSLIVAAHDEEEVIAAKVANALALDYPRGLLELIVACDGCADRTAELARGAGADLVLELPRAGKVPAQNAAVERASGELLAFSDANALWEPDALRELVAPFGDPAVGYACGQARLLDQGGSNQEGAYWRYELAVRELESSLAGVTAGNGAIYAVRASAYLALGPAASHDLSFPFMLTKRGLRAVYAPAAVSEEKMVATTEGEFSRKRRMMRGLYDEVVRDGMLAPRGYPAGLRLGDLQPPGAPLRLAAPAPDRAGHQPGPARPGHRVRVHARGAAAVAGRGGARRGDPDRAVPDRALLRADDRLDRGGLLGPDPPRHARGLGEGGGHAVSAASWTWWSPGSRSSSRRRCW